jgi:anti-sigma factor RsiW
MSCGRVRELLAAYADGGLDGRERDDVAAHVAKCPDCAEEVRALRDLLAETRRLVAPPPRDEAFWIDLARDIRVAVAETPPRVAWWRLPAVAAGLVAAFAAVLFVTASRGPNGANRSAPPAPTTSAKVTIEELYDDEPAGAENLVENLSEDDVARVRTAL